MHTHLSKVSPVHTISMAEQDKPWHEASATLWVNPKSTVPLCARCQGEYQRGEIGLLKLLTLEEQLDAVEAAGGILPAAHALTSLAAKRKDH